MTFGSLFTGSGLMDRALESAGMTCRWQVENDRACNRILKREWPGVTRHGDIRAIDTGSLASVDVVAGGDPCPSRSNPRHIHGSNSADLWPEFLRIVRALRPVWVLRENVVSRDADDCYTDLCRLGYVAVILETDGAAVTGQSRRRDYLCGVLESAGLCPGAVFHEPQGAGGHPATHGGPSPLANCLTTHPARFDLSDNYVIEPGRGTRILCPEERERLQGVRPGWTAGLPDRTRARLMGNAVVLPVVAWIAKRIVASENSRVFA